MPNPEEQFSSFEIELFARIIDEETKHSSLRHNYSLINKDNYIDVIADGYLLLFMIKKNFPFTFSESNSYFSCVCKFIVDFLKYPSSINFSNWNVDHILRLEISWLIIRAVFLKKCAPSQHPYFVVQLTKYFAIEDILTLHPESFILLWARLRLQSLNENTEKSCIDIKSNVLDILQFQMLNEYMKVVYESQCTEKFYNFDSPIESAKIFSSKKLQLITLCYFFINDSKYYSDCVHKTNKKLEETTFENIKLKKYVEDLDKIYEEKIESNNTIKNEAERSNSKVEMEILKSDLDQFRKDIIAETKDVIENVKENERKLLEHRILETNNLELNLKKSLTKTIGNLRQSLSFYSDNEFFVKIEKRLISISLNAPINEFIEIIDLLFEFLSSRHLELLKKINIVK